MNSKRLTMCFAVAAILLVSSITNQATASGLAGGSWGGSLGGGFGSRGLAGGSWGGAYRTPVRDFFANRQPARRLLRGTAGVLNGMASRVWGSRGGSGGSLGGGSGGFNYYSSGFSSTGGSGSTGAGFASPSFSAAGSTGSSFISAAPSSSFAYAPPVTYAAPIAAPAVFAPSIQSTIPSFGIPAAGISSCPDCIGSSAVPFSSAPLGSNSIIDPNAGFSSGSVLSDGTIIGDQSVIPAEQYYDSGDSSPSIDSSSEGSGFRGFESPPSPEPASGDETTDLFDQRDDGVLQVNVPAECQIFVNNQLTSTAGLKRSYVSKNLKRGKQYKFNVEAVIKRDGKEISLSKDVVLRAGRKSQVNFDFDQPVMTLLTVKVPENAKIELCGNQTKAVGDVRNFRTRLMPGQTWDDYHVLVSYEKDGEMVESKKTLSITAGQDYVVDFTKADTDYYVKK